MKKKTVRGGSNATNKRMRCRRRVNAKTRRNRTRRGGSTTEQIGAAAQLRAYFPYNESNEDPVHKALNDIVHHENRANRFHDITFSYDPHAQVIINQAYRIINEHPEHEPAIKDQMHIAKRKAERSMPRIFPKVPKGQKVPKGPVEEFPDLPRLVKDSVPYVGQAPVHVQVANIHAPHLARSAAEGAIMHELPDQVQVAMHPPPPLVGTVNAAATKRLLTLLGKNS